MSHNSKLLRQKLKIVEELLCELRAHQLELEIQNDNLQQIQQNLEKCGRHYANLYEFAPISYVVLNHDGVLIEINHAALEFFKKRRDELLHRHFIEFVAVDDGDRWQRLFKDLMARVDEGRQNVDLALKREDGMTFNACLECLRTKEANAPPELRIALTNISERKEHPNWSSRRHERNIPENQLARNFGLSELELATGKMHWLGGIYEIFEVDENTFDGSYDMFMSYVHVDDREKVSNALVNAMKRKTPYQILHRIQMKDGRIKWVAANCLIRCDTQGQPVRSTCMMEDVSKKVQINDLLHISTQQYKSFFDSISCGVMYLDSECCILSASPAVEKIVGLPFSDLLGVSLLDACWQTIHEDGSEFSANSHPVVLALRTGKRIGRVVMGLFNPQLNETVWLSVDAIPQFDADELKPFAVYFCFEDITKRKKIETRLIAAERRYRALLFGASDAILIISLDGYVEEMNRSAEHLLGINKQKTCCLHISAIYPTEESAKIEQYFAEVMACGSERLESKIIRQEDGKRVDVEIHASLIEVDGRVVIQGIFINITDRKKQEQQRLAKELTMRHALVREVHHRIKNNLQGITGVLCQFAEKHPETAEPINQVISQMRSVAIIHGLQGRANTCDVRLGELIDAITTEIACLWQKPIKVDIPDDWIPWIIVESEAVPLALVLNELVSNAVKHGKNSEFIEITLRSGANSESVQVTIYNTGQLPDDFDNSKSGLNLVALLMPPVGANLAWQQQGYMVITLLDLFPPIITLEPQMSCV